MQSDNIRCKTLSCQTAWRWFPFGWNLPLESSSLVKQNLAWVNTKWIWDASQKLSGGYQGGMAGAAMGLFWCEWNFQISWWLIRFRVLPKCWEKSQKPLVNKFKTKPGAFAWNVQWPSSVESAPCMAANRLSSASIQKIAHSAVGKMLATKYRKRPLVKPSRQSLAWLLRKQLESDARPESCQVVAEEAFGQMFISFTAGTGPSHFEEKRNLVASFPVGRTAPLDLWCSQMISHPWLPNCLTMVSLWLELAVGKQQPSKVASRMSEHRMNLRRTPLQALRWLRANCLGGMTIPFTASTGIFWWVKLANFLMAD